MTRKNPPGANSLKGCVETASSSACMLVIILAATLRAAVGQDGSFAGVISEITCAAQIIEVGAKKQDDLTQVRNNRRPVATGDRLRCIGAGQIVVRQGPTSKIITKSDGWVTLRPSPILNSIVKSSDLAGTRQGDEQPIYSPPADGAVRAKDFTIRWNRWPGIGSVTISVWSKETRDKFCCDGTFDGTMGLLASSELRRTLTNLRNRDAPERKLILNISGSLLRDYLVGFSVLSEAEEEQLDRDLTSWEGKSTLLRHLGRAFVFSSYRLYTQAAEASETALALAPTSPYLLAQSIEAERSTGNAVKAKELEGRLTLLGRRRQ